MMHGAYNVKFSGWIFVFSLRKKVTLEYELFRVYSSVVNRIFRWVMVSYYLKPVNILWIFKH